VTGSAFTAMRSYIRRKASQGWIIDLTPEGQTPPIPTRMFPGVRQPLAVALFVRQPDTADDKPATLRYIALEGKRDEKLAALAKLKLDGPDWQPVREGWADAFTPAATSGWDDWPTGSTAAVVCPGCLSDANVGVFAV
jgi:hypothetical protein